MKPLKIYLIGLIILINSAAALIASDAEKIFSYDMIILNSNAILCEPMHILLIATYHGIEPINAFENKDTIFVNNEKANYNCFLKGHMVEDVNIPKKLLIKPGDIIKIGDDLRCYAPFSKPGKYEVRIEKKLNEELTLKWPSFTVVISEPTGIDKKLFDAAQERNIPDMKSCQKDQFGNCKKDLLSPCIDSRGGDKCFDDNKISLEEMLDNYPTSCYTAWIPSSSISENTVNDPRTTVKFIKANKYWDGNSIYDPKVKGYFKRLDGPDYDKWKREKILEILKYCPRFPRKDGLIVTAAISNIVLGNEKEGIEMLKKLINESNSREAAWAKQFLEEWTKQKSRL